MDWELRCSRHTAELLGAIQPMNIAEHRMLKSQGAHILIRDREGEPWFWPLASKTTSAVEITKRSTA